MPRRAKTCQILPRDEIAWNKIIPPENPALITERALCVATTSGKSAIEDNVYVQKSSNWKGSLFFNEKFLDCSYALGEINYLAQSEVYIAQMVAIITLTTIVKVPIIYHGLGMFKTVKYQSSKVVAVWSRSYLPSDP